MYAAEREQVILRMLQERGFVGIQELDRRLAASPATLRRDLERLAGSGRLRRVRGGARAATAHDEPPLDTPARGARARAAIGRAAAALCSPGDTVIIDGGATALCMCPHLGGLGLQVLTRSLHVVDALLSQADIRISIPGGAVFRKQGIVLSAFEEDGASRYRASKMFLDATGVGPDGAMQADPLLVQAARRLFGQADQIVLLADSSRFEAPAGQVLCGLEEISTLVTDERLPDACAAFIEAAGVKVIAAPGL